MTATSTETKQMSDIAQALELLLHMVNVLSEGDRPTFADVGQVRELIERIKYPQRT